VSSVETFASEPFSDEVLTSETMIATIRMITARVGTPITIALLILRRSSFFLRSSALRCWAILRFSFFMEISPVSFDSSVRHPELKDNINSKYGEIVIILKKIHVILLLSLFYKL